MQNRRNGLLALSILYSFFVFISKSFNLFEVGVNSDFFTYLIISSILVYFWLFVMYEFSIKKTVVIYIIPQVILLLAGELIFAHTFFVRSFVRNYEILSFLALVLLFMGLNYSVLLMSNIFYVSIYKNIPLKQVAKTASYIVSLISIYFWTFNVLSFEKVGVVGTILILSAIYGFNIYVHLRHLGFTSYKLRRYTLLTLIMLINLLNTILFVGLRPELIALVPLSGFFVTVGYIMHRNDNAIRWYTILEYLLIIVITVSLNFIFR